MSLMAAKTHHPLRTVFCRSVKELTIKIMFGIEFTLGGRSSPVPNVRICFVTRCFLHLGSFAPNFLTRVRAPYPGSIRRTALDRLVLFYRYF